MGEEGNQSRGEAGWDWGVGGTWPKGQKGGLKQEGGRWGKEGAHPQPWVNEV